MSDPLLTFRVKIAVLQLAEIDKFIREFTPRVSPCTPLYYFFRDMHKSLVKLVEKDEAFKHADEILKDLRKKNLP